MLRVLILKVIVWKNDVYSLPHFSVCSAKVKSLICRSWTWLLEKIEMEQSVGISVARPRVSNWPYLNAIYVAKHHLWHQSWRSSWQWQLGLRTLNYSLVSSIFGGKSFYSYSFPQWGRQLALHSIFKFSQFSVSLASIVFHIST